MRYFVEVMRGVLMRGAGFADLWFQLAFLAALGLGVMALAVSRFRTAARVRGLAAVTRRAGGGGRGAP